MNSQEAQQAQTIARIEMEIKLSRATMISHGEARAKKNVVALLEIVDSQAQKIAQLTKERDAMTATAYRLGSESQQYISEARAEAEKWRQETIEYKYGNQWTQDGFALEESEKLPWEKL